MGINILVNIFKTGLAREKICIFQANNQCWKKGLVRNLGSPSKCKRGQRFFLFGAICMVLSAFTIMLKSSKKLTPVGNGYV